MSATLFLEYHVQTIAYVVHAYSIAASLFFLAWVHYYRREPEACGRLCRECLDISNEQGFGLLSAWARVLDGSSLFETGKPNEGIAEIREGIGVVNANRIGLCLDVFKGILAECKGKQGNLEEAISLLDEAAADSDLGASSVLCKRPSFSFHSVPDRRTDLSGG